MSLQQKPCHSQVASNQPFLQAYCSRILRSVESHRDRFYIIRHSGQGPYEFLWQVSFIKSAAVCPSPAFRYYFKRSLTSFVTSVWN